MLANLPKAHQALDKAVEATYGYKGEQTDVACVAICSRCTKKSLLVACGKNAEAEVMVLAKLLNLKLFS